jgi:hypothetical protein
MIDDRLDGIIRSEITEQLQNVQTKVALSAFWEKARKHAKGRRHIILQLITQHSNVKRIPIPISALKANLRQLFEMTMPPVENSEDSYIWELEKYRTLVLTKCWKNELNVGYVAKNTPVVQIVNEVFNEHSKYLYTCFKDYIRIQVNAMNTIEDINNNRGALRLPFVSTKKDKKDKKHEFVLRGDAQNRAVDMDLTKAAQGNIAKIMNDQLEYIDSKLKKRQHAIDPTSRRRTRT